MIGFRRLIASVIANVVILLLAQSRLLADNQEIPQRSEEPVAGAKADAKPVEQSVRELAAIAIEPNTASPPFPWAAT